MNEKVNKIGYIYKLSWADERPYIGQTIHLLQRIVEHLQEGVNAKLGGYSRSKKLKLFTKYDLSCLTVEILAVYKDVKKSELQVAKAYYTNKHNGINRCFAYEADNMPKNRLTDNTLYEIDCLEMIAAAQKQYEFRIELKKIKGYKIEAKKQMLEIAIKYRLEYSDLWFLRSLYKLLSYEGYTEKFWDFSIDTMNKASLNCENTQKAILNTLEGVFQNVRWLQCSTSDDISRYIRIIEDTPKIFDILISQLLVVSEYTNNP